MASRKGVQSSYRIFLHVDRKSLSKSVRRRRVDSNIEILELLYRGYEHHLSSHQLLVLRKGGVGRTKLIQCRASSSGNSFKKSLRSLGSIFRETATASSRARSSMRLAKKAIRSFLPNLWTRRSRASAPICQRTHTAFLSSAYHYQLNPVVLNPVQPILHP